MTHPPVEYYWSQGHVHAVPDGMQYPCTAAAKHNWVYQCTKCQALQPGLTCGCVLQHMHHPQACQCASNGALVAAVGLLGLQGCSLLRKHTSSG